MLFDEDEEELDLLDLDSLYESRSFELDTLLVLFPCFSLYSFELPLPVPLVLDVLPEPFALLPDDVDDEPTAVEDVLTAPEVPLPPPW